MRLDWIEEKMRNTLMETYSISPRRRLRSSRNRDWLLYSAEEIIRIMSAALPEKMIVTLRLRLNTDKRRASPLLKLKNIGW
jgi:replicative superfamily II helicase